MKYHQPLDDLLGTRSKVRILRRLVRARSEVNGRQLAAELGLSPWTCHLALRELAADGVLLTRSVGRASLYRLNERNYVVAKLLRPLFESEAHLLETAVREVIKRLPPSVVSIILYGSVVRQAEQPFSDIDCIVLVASRKARDPVQLAFEEKNNSFVMRFGNVLAPLVLPVADFRRRYRSGDSLLQEVVDTGRVIYGLSIAEVLSRDSQQGRLASHRAK